MDNIKPRTKAEQDRLRKIAEQWDKPLSPPCAVPKSVPKKRGRPAKEDK
jgi:hypothetical protein